MGVDVARGLFGELSGMNSNARKVVTEALLHVFAQTRFEWRARACEGAIHARRGSGRTVAGAWKNGKASDARRGGADLRVGVAAQHLRGDAVSLQFQRIVTRAHGKLALQGFRLAFPAGFAERRLGRAARALALKQPTAS